MNNNDTEIWSNLSEQADQFELPVEDFVWDEIESEVFPQKKKRGFFFWFKIGSGVFFIGLLTAASSLLFSHPTDEIDHQKRLKVHKNEMTRHSQSFAPASIETEPIESNAIETNVQRTSLATQSPPVQQTRPQFTTRTSNVLTENRLNSSTNTSVTNEALEPVNQLADLYDQNELSTATLTEPLKHVSVETSEKEIDSDTSQVLSAVSEAATAAIDNSDSTEALSSNDSIIPVNDLLENAAKETSRFSILLHGGVGESFRRLTSSSHHELIVHKNDHETFGGCFAVGADLQFKLNDRFILRTGLGYKFYSDKYYFQHDLISHRTRNDYQYLKIPLILGYSLWSNNRSNLYLLGGGNANLLSSAQSSWIDPSLLVPVAHSSQSTNTPFRSYTAGITLGLDYNLQISHHFKLHLIPSIDTFLNSIYKRETDLNELPYSFNLDIGISYNF